MSNRALVLTATPSSKVISNNLKAIHKASKAFITSENLERSGELLYITLEPQEILNTLQETMFTSNEQRAENRMAQ